QRQQAAARPAAPSVERLSDREREVLHLVAQGQDNPQIAAALSLAEGTVKNHITNIYAKLGVHSRAEAVSWFWKHMPTTPPPDEPS
ncbi:MAG: helix-turn-helix transcriptional regulator, partial [Chloroflexales bacterium]|nr:helix-turn-helix transcriptional regulator [Chloroflexales bacterium]